MYDSGDMNPWGIAYEYSLNDLDEDQTIQLETETHFPLK